MITRIKQKNQILKEPGMLSRPSDFRRFSLSLDISVLFVLWIAFLAIHRPAFSGLERDLAFRATVSTNCFVHLSRASVESASPEAASALFERHLSDSPFFLFQLYNALLGIVNYCML